MADAYLTLAERVLEGARRPLTPLEILRIGYARELVPWHLYGKTQHKTLQARLSEDVSARPEGSRFYRTAPGEFFLKSLKNAPELPEKFRTEFPAPPRRKELKREAVLAVRALALVKDETDFQCISIATLGRCLREGHYAFRQWKELQRGFDYLPVYSFVVVHRQWEVLSFKPGKFRPRSDPLSGARSIGFGGSVFASDLDLTFDSFFGIVGNGIRELVYGIGLTRRLAEKARYEHLVPCHLATVVRPPNQAHRYVHVVMTYRCPDEFPVTKNTLSLNDLRWLPTDHLANDLGSYDATSRFLFEQRKLNGLTMPARQAALNG